MTALEEIRARVALMRELGVSRLADGGLRIRLGPAPPAPQGALEAAPAADIGRVVPDDSAILYAAAGRVPPDLRKLRGL